jgi:hypothetical protein
MPFFRTVPNGYITPDETGVETQVRGGGMDKKLTVRSVAALNSKGNYHDGGGLYLQVTIGAEGSPRKSWLYRFVSPETKRERYMGLGSLEDVTLARAREARDAARAVLKGGADPIEERERTGQRSRIKAAEAVAKATTFDQCAAAYFASHQAAWKNPKHRQQWQNTLKTYVSPVFGSLPVAAIDTALVVTALGGVDTYRIHRTMAARVTTAR